MFTKIGEERAFDAILGQIIENIQTGWLKARGCASGRTVYGREYGEYPDLL